MLKLLLFVHTVSAVCALAVTVHLGLRLWKAWGEPAKFGSRLRLHGLMTFLFYLGTVITGALLYPEFRYSVRHLFLDSAAPHATMLFELKEHFAALGLFPVIGLYLLFRRVDGQDAWPMAVRFTCAALVLIVFSVLAFNTLAGWYIVTVKSL